MKQRPSIVVFAGQLAESLELLYKTQLDERADLISCVCLKGNEDCEAVHRVMADALECFTAERLQGLVDQGLLDAIDLWTIPVLIVVHHNDGAWVRKVAAALLKAAGHPNLDGKLRFTTLVMSAANLNGARTSGNELVNALDGLVTQDGVTFRNTVLLVCKEVRGAPVSDKSLGPILARIVLLLTTFDYDPDRSKFSDFWNSDIGGGGRVYFIGLAAYRVERLRSHAHKILYSEAGARLTEILLGNSTSLIQDLRPSTLAAAAFEQLRNVEPGTGLVNGSEEWEKLAERYRSQVVPAILRQLLPQVRSINELRIVLETIQGQVRPNGRQVVNGPTAVASLAIIALPINSLILGILATALTILSIVGILAWSFRNRIRFTPIPPPPTPSSSPCLPQSPIFFEVLGELIQELKEVGASAKSQIDSIDKESECEIGRPSRELNCSEKLQFCECVYDAERSGRAAIAAREAVNDVFRLLLLTKLKGGKWLSAEMAANMRESHDLALRSISAAILSDFIDFVAAEQDERSRTGAFQEVLFAPTLQAEQANQFCFVGNGLEPVDDQFERCAVANTINHLYLVE
jgi:hypothetical protein